MEMCLGISRYVWVFGDCGSMIGVEEYWGMFIGSKTVEFKSERAWEWSLEELWCVICNGVVSVYEVM